MDFSKITENKNLLYGLIGAVGIVIILIVLIAVLAGGGASKSNQRFSCANHKRRFA